MCKGRIFKSNSFFYKRIVAIFLAFSFSGYSCQKTGDVAEDASGQIKTVSLLPDTGQTTSYTATTGEDADYLINPMSFTDNNNGTITDNFTGLMWQKTDGGEMAYESTSSYVKALTLGGFNDWRLPTSHELFLIDSYDNVNPALHTS